MKKLTLGNWFVIIVAAIIIFLCLYGLIYKSHVIDFKKPVKANTTDVIIDSTQVVD